MTSRLFDSMGLSGIDIGIILLILFLLTIVSLVLMIIFIVKEEKLRKRYQIFMGGKDAKSLEESIGDLFIENRTIKEKLIANRKDIKAIYRQLTKVFQKVGLVKYDAYQQMGGMLSFALAMLDEEDNGFILNSVHSAEGCYIYSKDIKEGKCELELGKEEKQALDIAMQMANDEEN